LDPAFKTQHPPETAALQRFSLEDAIQFAAKNKSTILHAIQFLWLKAVRHADAE